MNSLFSLEGKVAVVTGASSGLGVQFAKSLAAQGAKVALLARRTDRIDQIRQELEQAGHTALSITCDVTNETSISSAVQAVKDAFGRIDILVNNAGVSEIAPAEQMSREQWDKVIATNLTGVFLVAKHVGQLMIEQHYGKIINISSMFGIVANSAFPVANYHASKFGVVGLTKDLAAEWARHNVTVNAIGPGFFESEMTESAISTETFTSYVQAFCPMKRIGKAGELNGALVYLASDASSYTTGQVIAVDGGWTAI